MKSESNLKYTKENVKLRRGRTLELAARGMSQIDISRTLGVDSSTTSLDLQYCRCKAQENLKTHIQNTIPLEYEKAMAGLKQVLLKVWIITEQSQKTDEKLRGYALINDCYKYIIDMTTNAATIGEAMKFVLDNMERKKEERQEQTMELSSSEEDLEGEIKEPEVKEDVS